MSAAIVFREALSLPQEDRVRLIDSLCESLGPDYQQRIEEAQLAEVNDRWAAYKLGEIALLNGPDVMAELRSRYAQ
jgi:putative addiction module component (TIGR02574 family)